MEMGYYIYNRLYQRLKKQTKQNTFDKRFSTTSNNQFSHPRFYTLRLIMVKASKLTLSFQKPIISTSEHLISTRDLLENLASLHEELSTLPQDKVDLRSLDGYQTDLCNKKLIKHKDAGIRAFTACCLSDILRLYAPDAPYTDTQLTDIFKLFLSQFEHLGELDNGYIVQQTYLITKLLEYRSIVLLADLPTANKLLENLFEIFYDDSKTYQSKLFNVIGSLLGEVISEFDSVPLSVLKLIFNKFLTYNPTELPKGLTITSNCGYEISLILCDAYASRMGRNLTRYYSEILFHVTNDDESGPSYQSKIQLSSTITKLHKLIIRLWETVPELIASAIGFIYQELSSENEELRKQATKLIGQILSIDSELNFVTTHQDTFNAWMIKIADINPEIRIQWIEAIPTILAVRDDISKEIEKGLVKTLMDSDARVRKSSVLVFHELPVSTIWTNITNPVIYSTLLHLIREKNKDVRELSINTVSKLYYDSIESIDRTFQNTKIWDIIDTIPSVLFNLYYINVPNINEQVDRMIFENILPMDTDNEKRIKRLMHVLSDLDKKAFTSFFAFNKRQPQMALAFSKYIEFCQTLASADEESSPENSTRILTTLQKTIDWLASGLSDSLKANEALETLRKINDQRIFFLIKTCIGNNVPFATLKNSYNELINKLQDSGLFRKYPNVSISTIMPKELARIINILLLRSSPIIYNVSNIPFLLDMSHSADSNANVLRHRLLDNISAVNPTLFKDQVKVLRDQVIKYEDSDDEEAVLGLNETLKTLYKISKGLKEHIDFNDNFFLTKLSDIALEGTPTMAKYATKIICMSPTAAELLTRIKKYILPLDKHKDKCFTSHIIVLMEIFKFHPHILDNDSTDIVSYLIKEILLSNKIVGEKENNDLTWIQDSSLDDKEYSALAAKLFTLKLFTNKLRSIAPVVKTDELAKTFVEKTIKLFFYLIASGGELVAESDIQNYPTPSTYQIKLRCYSGLQILKLAKIPTLQNFIKSSEVVKLINLVEDESLSVRKTFLDTLKTYIGNELISIRFLPLIFFTMYEPNNDLKKNTKTWINYTFSKESFRKGTFFERILPRLIHSIAHHPDIIDGLKQGTDDSYLNSLTTAIDYLLFYFDSIAIQENFNLLYYLSERVKNYQDRVADEEDETTSEEDVEGGERAQRSYGNSQTRVYIISELSQMILLKFKERKGWQHSAYPGKLNLPGDIFKPFVSIKDAQLSFRSYLDDRYAAKLENNIKAKVNRIFHTSQTHRQRAQKRLLANEINDSNSKRRKQRKINKQSDQSDKEAAASGSEEEADAYKPSQKIKSRKTADNNVIIRKNLRTRKAVDYRDSDDEDEDNEPNDENHSIKI
ncbi:sister chromatid cohesion factor PDS5 NDAI_0H01340 [Naumovozyma dairenensis CBS 421]|uniref:Sister chromatid cohesion protein n=1 Tax=Naumovozyma dairenensis (strain ATCC 10597 / BCRC 20456 / CBS 421 / NBRC 0211 / NRRL Y-12639) TaxID=1071378 RepID=G0WEU7_NAUDC|nr:hypothetical protein NDAI_0H01340 [Naumovozyma dairenensis CBS 421]CCD26308.1 hypothetical protein NDAI_0H01340 [Naumovozyma dairenensis CBS 421]